MDQELIKGLASQGVFALLFGVLGYRFLKMADEDRKWNREVAVKIVMVLDKLLADSPNGSSSNSQSPH